MQKIACSVFETVRLILIITSLIYFTKKVYGSSPYSLQLACMKPESLVIAGQPYGSEFVLGPCTHRSSHYGS
uniref:Uncharacterized protein n=1 Tax=Kalanchoe fedtschenkoi TaxID=63787 RepID=A0A7N0ZXC6_KALFE